MKTNDQKPSQPPAPGGTATILLVEDDPGVRNVVRLILTRGGYRVIEADSEPEALWKWDKHWREIDLLLTDIMIPSATTGVDLAKKLRSRKTDLRVIFTSGFSLEVGGIDVYESDDTLFLQKPYEPAALLAKVRECLGEPPLEAPSGHKDPTRLSY